MKLPLVVALAGATLLSGCILPPPPPDVFIGPPPPPLPFPGFIEPSIVIVEGGVPHDRAFYARNPEIYHRDRARHPERFRHGPPPHRPDRYGPQPDRYGPQPPPGAPWP